MEIIQKPDSLSLLGNLKKFLISSNAEVDFSLSVSIDGADVSLLQESYTPDSSGNISIDIREVCGQYLKTNLPSDNVFLQSDALRTFTATIGSSSWSFTVVNASVRNLTLSALEYLQYNFLTLQPQSKQVSWHSPEYLTYYFTEQADVQAKFYLKSGGTETVTVATISPTPEGGSGTIQLVNKVYTINTSLSRLMALSSNDTEDLQGIVDVWVQGSVSRLSYIQRYVYAPSTGEEHHYFAVNSLGGIDTFTFIGEQKITGEIEHQAAENDDKKITVTSGGQRKYRQNTGYLGEASSEWLWEFLHSSRQWAVAGAAAEEIVVISSSLSQGDMTNLNSSSFDFLLARDGGLLPESRRDETFPDITVPSPVSDLFFLNPRIIDFPAAPSDAELVFPVQTPYSNEWSYLTLQELQERLSIAASLNHTHRNLSVLQALGESNGQLTYRGVVIGSGGGISLPIAISDVEGLSTILNNKAKVSHSHRWADITDRPTRLTDFTNNLVPSWALAIEKPSYNFSEIQNKPTTLSGYGITDGYSSLTTSGSGNAITAVSGTGHSLTFTKGNTFVDLASEQTISGRKHIYSLDVTGALAIPQVEPTAESGKVFEYIDHSGSFGESSGSVTPADLKDLTLKINGVTQTTYNPASPAQFNVDLTNYAQKSWVEAKNYLQGITKAMVENVLTGNITSHTHSQYLTSHQSLSGYATESWVQQQGYLTSHQSLADYALKSEIPTSMAWTAITGRPTKLSQFTNDIISSWALTATKPSYTLDEVTDGSSRKLSNYVLKAGDTMTGNLVVPSVRAANTYYGISFGRSNVTPVETILYTGIKWATSSHMPVLHITGFAYGLQSPVEFKIGFYIYSNKIGWCGVTNMGSWAPQVYLFKYTNTDSIDCVAVGLAGSCYFLQLQADVQDEMGKFANIIVDRDKWSWSFQTTTGTIPAADGGTTCIAVPYKADILSLAWSKVTGKPTSLSGYGITDGYSSLSTTGNGNAITSVSGSGHALTFTKGNIFVDLASEQTISGKKHISYLDVTGALPYHRWNRLQKPARSSSISPPPESSEEATVLSPQQI